MTKYRIVSEPRANLDVAAAFDWYENREPGLGKRFAEEVRATFDRIAESPFAYQEIRSGIRRAIVRRFPYVVYFVVEPGEVVVLAVLHVNRDPKEWQRRRS
ncbi:MAG: type II toxin-antitoxin system RelE/ParE family toxin [Pseudomonadota bacterium]